MKDEFDSKIVPPFSYALNACCKKTAARGQLTVSGRGSQPFSLGAGGSDPTSIILANVKKKKIMMVL